MNKIQENKIPDGWKIEKLGDIIKKIIDNRGKTPPLSSYGKILVETYHISNTSNNLINIGDNKQKYVSEEIFKTYFRSGHPIKGDILFSLVGERIPQVNTNNGDFDFCIGQNLVGIRLKHGIESYYISYLMKHFKFKKDVKLIMMNNAQPSIKLTELVKINILLPSSLKEQQKIAEILSTVDDAIEKTDALIKKYKKIKTGLMEDLFTKGIDLKTGKPHTKFKESELGKIPESWEVEKLGEITLKITDGTHSTPKYTDNGIPFLRVTDVQEKNINFKKIKYISLEEHNELIVRCFPEKGDILYSKNGTIGIPKIVDWNWDFSLFVSLCLIKIKKEKSKILNKYLYHYLKSSFIKIQIDMQTKTGTVTNLHLEEIKMFKIFLPNIKEQEAIADILVGADENIEREVEYKEKLEKIKRGLMEDLLSGKVRV